MIGHAIFIILRMVLTSQMCKRIAADQIERLVKRTDTPLDDAMAEPFLRFLRK